MSQTSSRSLFILGLAVHKKQGRILKHPQEGDCGGDIYVFVDNMVKMTDISGQNEQDPCAGKLLCFWQGYENTKIDRINYFQRGTAVFEQLLHINHKTMG